MSHHRFRSPRASPAVRQPPRPKGIPHGRFGALCGTVDQITFNSRGGDRPDDNHIYVWLRVEDGPFAGRYECAVNIKSTVATSPVEYCVREEPVALEDFPASGFWESGFSYRRAGLQQSDFEPIGDQTLAGLVQHFAETCSRLCVFGRTYSNWHGVHDIHLNWGEPNGSPFQLLQMPDGDGAMAFYFRAAGAAGPVRRWLFLKFASQAL